MRVDREDGKRRVYKVMILSIYGTAPELLASLISQTSRTTNAPIWMSEPPLVPTNRCGMLNPCVRDVNEIKHLVLCTTNISPTRAAAQPAKRR